MGFNNVPVNGWPQIKDLERLNELAQKIDGLSTLTSSDRDWLDEWESKLPELPEDPATDGIKVLTATTDDGETVKSWEDPASGVVDYSTTEQATGQKWIDGSDIYQKTIKVLAANFTQDGALYRIDYPLQATDEVIYINALAHSASYGDVILGSKSYSDNTPTAYWEMVTYYNYLALNFSGGLTFASVSPEYIEATYYYVKSAT